VALLLGLVVLVSGSRPASAHAELIGTEPASGAVMAEAPSEVVLRFTENVSVEADGVRILGADGERRDAGDARAAGAVVTVPLDGTLARGGYVVAWRVISADGHPISGAYQFSVGVRSQVDAAVADEAFGAGSDRRDEQAGQVLRAVAYLCTLVAAGATFVGDRSRGGWRSSPAWARWPSCSRCPCRPRR
jgi:copper transport protein